MALAPSDIDVIAAGAGPLAVLVHSSVSGARQWRRLVEVLSPTRRVLAPNLYGYGRTPAWQAPPAQAITDQSALVRAVIPDAATGIALVGHSFGATIAMQVAAELGSRVTRLVLVEPNPFMLLQQHGRDEAFAEPIMLRNVVKTHGARGDWQGAAERFTHYWTGPGAWAAMPEDRRAVFVEALKPNFHEWDAAMTATTPLAEWAAKLPAATTVLYGPETTRAIREIVDLMRQHTRWDVRALPAGGHMAPLTHADVVNPLIAALLRG